MYLIPIIPRGLWPLFAHNSVRRDQISGNNTTSSILRRQVMPPVSRLKPVTRSTVITWRKRHRRMAFCWSVSSSPRWYKCRCAYGSRQTCSQSLYAGTAENSVNQISAPPAACPGRSVGICFKRSSRVGLTSSIAHNSPPIVQGMNQHTVLNIRCRGSTPEPQKIP